MSRRELDLEAALAGLAANLAFPPTPDLAAAVAARLEEGPARGPARARPAGARLRGAPDPSRRRRAWPGGRGWRRLAMVGLAAVLLAAAVLVASPQTREAVARRLGLRGIGVELGGAPPPTVTTAPPGGRLDLGLGQRVSLAEARRRTGFPVLVPGAAGFERPDAVFVDPSWPGGGRVDLVYLARPGLPASPFTDAGLLVTQFRGQPEPGFLKKVVVAGMVREVSVGGGPGYFFTGEPHILSYQDPAGTVREVRSRLAGNTLIWQHRDLTLRLEGELSQAEAVRIAESMR